MIIDAACASPESLQSAKEREGARGRKRGSQDEEHARSRAHARDLDHLGGVREPQAGDHVSDREDGAGADLVTHLAVLMRLDLHDHFHGLSLNNGLACLDAAPRI